MLRPKGTPPVAYCARIRRVVRRMLVAIIGRADVKPIEERAQLLEQELTSTLLQQRWKQAQLAAVLEQKENSAAQMLQTVQKLKGVAAGMRGKASDKADALAKLEREVIEQAVRMQHEKEEALDSARFHTEQILAQRERELREEAQVSLISERRRKALELESERQKLTMEKEARLQSYRQRADENKKFHEQKAMAAIRKAEERENNVRRVRRQQPTSAIWCHQLITNNMLPPMSAAPPPPSTPILMPQEKDDVLQEKDLEVKKIRRATQVMYAHCCAASHCVTHCRNACVAFCHMPPIRKVPSLYAREMPCVLRGGHNPVALFAAGGKLEARGRREAASGSRERCEGEL